MTVWFVGQYKEGEAWEIQGVFSTEDAAKAACRKFNYFYLPLILDENFPDETIPIAVNYPSEVVA